jgi:hypothetical protein
MKCRICARECPPGAKLCRDCAAARKRAFAATVTQPLLAAAGVPSIGHPRFAPRPAKVRVGHRATAAAAARSEAAIAASAAEGQVAPPRLARPWLWLALAVALVIVYLAARLVASNHGQSSGEAVTPGDTAHGSAAPETLRNAVVPPPQVAPPLPATTSVGEVVDSPDADAMAASAAAVKHATAKAHARKAAAKIEPPSPAPPPPEPKPEPAPVPRKPAPQATATRDPWQSMNDGLTRCAKEDWLGRATCEQRLRLQYCGKSWGLVPQCPIGPSDHGT